MLENVSYILVPRLPVTLTFDLLTSNLLSQLFVSPLNSKFLRISSFM